MINDILKNIMNGYDGLIRKIEFQSFENVSIIISVIKQPENKWVNVRFDLKGLKEFSIKQKLNYSNVVLSEGITYLYINNLHYIDFSPYSDVIDDESDFRKSNLYFASESISYEMLAYDE